MIRKYVMDFETFVNESKKSDIKLNESNDGFDKDKYLSDMINKINESDLKGFKKLVFDLTMCQTFPLNPREPLRSVFLNKVEELLMMNKEDSKLKQLQSILKMDPDDEAFRIPDGAMY